MFYNLTFNQLLEKSKVNHYLDLTDCEFQIYKNNINGGYCHFVYTIENKKIKVDCNLSCPLCDKKFRRSFRGQCVVWDIKNNEPKWADFPKTVLQEIASYTNDEEWQNLDEIIFHITRKGTGQTCSYIVIAKRQTSQFTEEQLKEMEEFSKQVKPKGFYKYEDVKDILKDV